MQVRSIALGGGVFIVAVVSLLIVAAWRQLIPNPLVAPQTATISQASPALSLPAAAVEPAAQAIAPTIAPTPVAVAAPTVSPLAGIQTVPVRRGPITDTVLLSGRVAGVDETPLSLVGRGTVSAVNVKAGDTVQQDQILLSADTKQAEKDLAAARASVDDANRRLQAAQAAAQAQQDVATVGNQDRLRQVQADLDRVLAGAAAADRQAADAAVLTARSNLEKAQADFARVSAGPTADALSAAKQQVTSAQVALRSAESEMAKLQAGPDPVTLVAAQKGLTDARSAMAAAQTAYERLANGPDSFELRAAQRAVDQAKLNVAVADASDPAKTGVAKDIAKANAQFALAEAQDKLAQLTKPASPAQLALARQRWEDEKGAVAAAQGALDAIKRGPDQLARDKAQVAVASARSAVQVAEANLAQLQAGPQADQLQAAQTAVDAAQLGLNSAEARKADVNSHPTPAELNDAQSRVAAVQAALSQPAPSSGAADIGSLQKAVADANQQVVDLQQALDQLQLRAPSAGVISQVQVQPGDAFQAGAPLIVMSTSADPVVRVSLLNGGKLSPVAVGQTASIQFDGLTGDPLTGKVVSQDAPASNGDQVALVQVDWGATRPAIGTAARLSITIQEKSSVLLIPQRAVHTAGTRKYVNYVDNGTIKSATVELGISTPADVEVVSGLQENQSVVLG